jgi:hypothetical protein
MGKTDGCKLEIGKISQTPPRFLEAKGITIATFASVVEPSELTEYFKTFERNFMVFDLDSDVSGFNLTNEKLHKTLFGHINEDSNFELEEMSNNLIDEIKKTSEDKISSGKTENSRLKQKDFVVKEKKGKISTKNIKLDYSYLEDLTKTEREEQINTILDKGFDLMTNEDRKILEILTKKS